MNFSNPQEIADNFIISFYPYFTHRDEKLLNFYSDDAIIMRKNQIKFSRTDPKMHLTIAFYGKRGTIISVASYQIFPLQMGEIQGFQILVTGIVNNIQTGKRTFVQTFILRQIQGRLFIIYDNFQYISTRTLQSFSVPNPMNN